MEHPENRNEDVLEEPDTQPEPDATLTEPESESPLDISPPRGQPFLIVGVGASAGGLEAVTQLLRALPKDTGMAFVFVQHLDPHHESQLTDLLASATQMPVHTVADRIPIEPNHVYVIPPNADLAIEDGKLRLLPRRPGLHLPVDTFFESLAHAQGGRAIGIVLSGNASDGSLGLRAIKGECGITFAQDEASARHSGMPRNAAATGAVDFVLPPAEIARELIRLSRHPYVVPPQPGEPQEEILPEGDGDLNKLFTILQSATKVDFSHYKQNTIRRRIGRRMIVNRMAKLAEYTRYVEKHPAEIRELYRDLLISVTNFFRDPEVFEALTQSLAGVLRERKTNEPFRFWAPGCATGEEVYSLAICLCELLERLELDTPLQFFGTDISESALDRARSGTYPEAIAENVSPERLRRFFVRVDSGYQVSKNIRECCVFARQDLTRDPPFAHTDVISCRNVLIYMDAALQRRVLPVFHYSLNPTGLLVLGSAETIGAAEDLFNVVNKQHRIYCRKAVDVRLTLDLALGRSMSEPAESNTVAAALSGLELQKKVDRIIQSKYSPAAVVVDREMQILHFRGQNGFYFDPTPGEASLNLLRMTREGLVMPLRRTIQAADARNVSTREDGIYIEHRGEHREVSLEVTPIAGPSPGERYFLIVFGEVAGPASPIVTGPEPVEKSSDSENQAHQLQQQLAETREYLRNLNEDHEASCEELRAANEEVRSANEELQSTNEELNTTKEELQSGNEELTTVNEELQNRNQELDAVNNDLSNLLGAVNIPILMVDNGLRVRRFNTAAEKLLDLGSIDVGRSVAHLRGNIELPELEQQVRTVLETLGTEQREVQDKAGRWYSTAVRPYRTADNRIDGAVVMFVDIDPLKRSLKIAEEARDYAEGMIETVHEPLVVLDADLRVQRATSSFYEMFQVSREETLGRFLYDLGSGQWNRPRLRELLGDALFRKQLFQGYEIKQEFPHIGHRTMRLSGRRIPGPMDGRRTLLLSIEDATERRQEAEVRYQRLFETAKDGMLVLDAETGLLTDVNPYFLDLTGYAREEFLGKRLDENPAFRGTRVGRSLMAETHDNELVRHDALPIIVKNAQRMDVELIANRYTIGNQQVVQVNIRDVTAREQTNRALRESEQRFRMIVESVRDYALFQMDLTGLISTWNPGAERLLGYREAEILGQPVALIFTPEDQAAGAPELERKQAQKEEYAEDERWHARKDGSRFFASGVMSAVRDENGQLRGFAKIMRDITERKQTEEQIQASLREKEVLLKEIHHRVKNNLQVITSLLGFQSDYVKDSEAAKAMEDMHNRVRSIAIIHEMLYGSPDFSRIDFGAYLVKMAQDLFAFYGVDPNRIRLQTDTQPASLEIGKAVPCGLIFNELLTNCLKHAFPGGREGAIHVSFGGSGDARVLTVSDDGVGFPKELDPPQETSMGLQLIHLLVEQLHGAMAIDREAGSRFTVSFPSKPE